MFDVGYKKLSVTVALGVAVLFSASCQRNENQAEWWQGEQERIELSHQVELMQYRLELRNGSRLGANERLTEMTQAIPSLLKSLQQQHRALSVEVAALEKKWPVFCASTIQSQRERAIGMTFETLCLSSGRKFQGVSVAGITDGGVTIRHIDGSARLRFADLDSEQQLLFGLEADSALAAAEKESQAANAYERAIDTQMAVNQKQEKMVSEITRRAELAAQEKWSLLAVRYVAAARTELFAQAATSLGSRPWGYSSYYPRYRAYRSYRPTYRYVYRSTIPSCNRNYRLAASSQTVRASGIY
jgi:hypothetical protein